MFPQAKYDITETYAFSEEKKIHYISSSENLTSAKNYYTNEKYNEERETRGRKAFFLCEPTEKF